ncbi:MAG TPA: PTS sugar transporter subunit IIB [Gemmatimonadaceae bacterium]|nr:PTS sugar transporter subunit IIB [Gemmatimonadaceae bacterium]
MSVLLYRIDDRLIHGQVVVGWGQPLGLGFIVLVDDEVAASEWEQELYRMGVPPEMDVYFSTVDEAARELARWTADPRPGILLTADIDTMCRLLRKAPGVRAINLGGIHHRAGRVQRLRYIYLAPAEEEVLRAIEASGVTVTARDVPAARALPLSDVLTRDGTS